MSSSPALPISISKDGKDFPIPQDLSTTPGGTIYGTTPGGTRIIYDRNALLLLRNSPMSKTPPTGLLHNVPGITKNAQPASKMKPKEPKPTKKEEDNDLFKMET
eukprot:TRINITY_DN230_c0_g1_i2.p1 TRINITY_DN230_c0_g1~~TRINITY_DN230_c0_g1_i2.p1  ORF type:complete len:104 (-),score=21.53 TRINITY_DN230_c0_g1_i2:188-499(-)